MTTTIFDGKTFAKEREKLLKLKVKELKATKGVPKLVAILVGRDKASLIYTNLKKKTAERVGIKFQVVKFPSTTDYKEIIKKIKELNKEDSVHGVMVQLPLPIELKKKTRVILQSIDKNKDVDGLRVKSIYTPAAVKAVSEIIQYVIKPLAYIGKKAAVVGAAGTVGKGVTKELTRMGFKVCECEKGTRDLYAKLHEVDIVVSATGVPGLISSQMLKEGVVAIDVGAPKGDIDYKAVSKMASFVTPVPGGVGPVTIICLLENLVEACYKK